MESQGVLRRGQVLSWFLSPGATDTRLLDTRLLRA